MIGWAAFHVTKQWCSIYEIAADSRRPYAVQSMRDIVGKCLIKDASKRPSAAQLLEHKFFKVAFPDHVYKAVASADGIDHSASEGTVHSCTHQRKPSYACVIVTHEQLSTTQCLNMLVL